MISPRFPAIAVLLGMALTSVLAAEKGRHIVIEADVGVAKGKATVWTCDLTHRYIDINGSYRS